MKRLIVVTSLLALWSVAISTRAVHAAGKPATGAGAATTAPPPELAKTVDAFNGKWSLETTMTQPGGKPVKFSETIDCRKGAQGHSAICVDRFTAPGEGRTEYDYLVGYDVDTKIVHLFAVGSPGEVHDHSCKWSSEKVLECVPLQATLGGQPITETFAFTFDGNKLTMKGTTLTKDGPISFEATGRRSGKYSLGHSKAI
jgi:hypothetical protein